MRPIHARPNLNGNTPQDFQRLALKTQEAAGTISDLIHALAGNVFHGRNYQTMDMPVGHRNLDLHKITLLAEMEADLREMAMAIFDASQADKPAHLTIKIKAADVHPR